MSTENTKEGKAARPFIRDLEPFVYGRPITYVDVGAYHGVVLQELLRSSIRVREAHLVEPNPKAFGTLTASADQLDGVGQLACHNVAVSSSPGVLTLRDEGTMTHVSSARTGDTPPDVGAPFFEATATTLDELARSCEIGPINLLKIDVEGHELAVLEGAKELLATESVDVIYVEAGMNPNGGRHVYYRDIEDALRAHGYRLFRFYEQRHEWQQDDPTLRRANLAFISSAFASSNPYNLSRELYKLRREGDELRGRVATLQGTVTELEARASQLREEHDDAVGRAEEEVASRQEREGELAAARRERDAFVAYADELEKKIRQLLRSSSWRITGPLRIAVRAARRTLGRPASTPTRLPHRPSGNELVTRLGSGAAAAEAAEQLMALLRRSDFAGAYRLQRQYQSQVATEDGFLSYGFAVVALAKKTSTFAFGAQAADAVFDRYRGRRSLLVAAFGATGYQRFVSDAAACYTRIGRYSAARTLLDEEIRQGATGLLPVRAEIGWIHDPEQSAHDIDTYRRRGGPDNGPRGNALLRYHLARNMLGEPDGTADASVERGEFRLVRAIRALADGRPREYRNLVNGYFDDQGLTRPFDPTDGPLSFDELGAGPAEPGAAGPLVTVIMTTYNSESTVRYAVKSILAQSHQNLELLIIDDGSADATLERLAELEASDERIRLISNAQNVGTYAARNLAMQQARGEYITFHDSDDWAHPQRLAVHVDAMTSRPELLATRSMWLRIGPDGKIDFRRWHKRVAHPNPASVFIKHEVLDRAGFFDTVRFGADSEYWYRVARVCGRAAVAALDECLGLGLHHTASLTRSGPGARNEEEYSPLRAAYQYSWLEWHARSPVEQLRLTASPDDRAFWAPDEMLATPAPNTARLASLARCYPARRGEDVPTFVFGISLASKQAATDWGLTERLLGRTLRSVINQTDGRWRAVVCGHDRPELTELDDPRVSFLEADIAPPADARNFRKDKMWKRRLIGSVLRDLGGGYFCPLDADDLVHKDLVGHMLADDNRRGYNIATGYAQDFANSRLAPVPGVWSAPFDRVCGTSAVLYFVPDELPRDGRMDPALYFNLFQSHAYWPVVAEEYGRPLAGVPFHGAVYVVNHSQNLSFSLQRAGDRSANIISSIERHAIDDAPSVLAECFGQSREADRT